MIRIQYDPYNKKISEILSSVKFDTDNKTVQELIDHYERGRLNLNPAFQRESVWKETQRRKLIKSIYENVPIPSIFLYEREHNGGVVYDVIDGKQRIESIFMYMGLKGFRGKRFWFHATWEEDDELLTAFPEWNDLEYKEKSKILAYPIQTITLKGSQSEIADVFVRINSTGSKLKPQEIRKANYLTSDFLKESVRIANKKKYKDYLTKNRILGADQISRQKHIELVSEIILSVHYGEPINKKRAIDETMRKDTLKGQQLKNASKKFEQTFNFFVSLFPRLKETRFRGVADFYTIFLLVWRWKYVDKLVLTDRKRKKLVQAYLLALGNNIDLVKEKQRNFQTSKIEEGESTFVNYLRTVMSSTDEINQRREREKILDSVLSDCFEKKDPFRTFSKEQRRIIWYQSNGHCSNRKCRKKLTINNFHIDHIKPHSKGGKTNLKNAQIMCAKCNLEKSNK
jgi:5-methylcytosine-specific restriction endonuclease McrA